MIDKQLLEENEILKKIIKYSYFLHSDREIMGVFLGYINCKDEYYEKIKEILKAEDV